MRSPRAVALEAELNWDATLHYRRGAPQRLRGIDVFYDFPWKRHFGDRRVQFRNGQCLADQVIEDCPAKKGPALLLTDRDDVEEGAHETDDTYVTVVNLPRYLATADGNAAAAYLVQRLGRGITRAKSFSRLGEAGADEFARWLDDALNVDVLTSWAGVNEERLELLRTIGTTRADNGNERDSDAERAVAALETLEELDPQVTEAIAALVLTETDVAARAELLWALTDDSEGRRVAGQTLNSRVAERLDDARAAADRFDRLLKSGGETEIQVFLEGHPWLLGLDYARVRPRQAIPRGAVDFLLERFDGFHDLLELKSPDNPIFETHGKEISVRSPSSYRLSRHLALALAQVHAYRDVLSHEDTIENLYGLRHTREPGITIIIGRASDLAEQETRLLRELNRSLHHVEIVPFDVLGGRARAVLDNVERYLLTADEEAGDA
jgi:hypothetical protein